MLKGESQAIAGANLQALFKQIVLNAGGRLESTQVLPGAASGVIDWIGIRAQFPETWKRFRGCCTELNSTNPYCLSTRSRCVLNASAASGGAVHRKNRHNCSVYHWKFRDIAATRSPVEWLEVAN
ncbi:MAG: hypothetical protein H6963_06275 [Chromatiaceae bacterium]|nr:hypothetical protein [Chromatiaceae bacterium]